MSDKETEAEVRAFNRGYLIACCNIVNGYDEPSMAADLVSSLDITASQINDMDLSEYDSDAVTEIIKMGGLILPVKP